MPLSALISFQSEKAVKWTKIAFISVNILIVPYVLLLLLVSSHEQSATVVASLPVLGGLQLGAVMALMPAVVSIVMIWRPRTRLLFVYSLLTLPSLVILMCAGVACAAVSEDKAVAFARTGLSAASDSALSAVRSHFSCCTALEAGDVVDDGGGDLFVVGRGQHLLCPSCTHAVADSVRQAFRAGGIMAFLGCVLDVGALYFAHAYVKATDPSRPIYFVSE